MYCCALCSSKFKPNKQAVFKLRTVEHAILFFFGILVSFLVFFKEAFVKNFLKKLSFFKTNFQNSFQDVVYYRILECQTL